MKTISRFVCIILLISIFTIHTPLALASDKAIRGHLDSISGDSISGWIWDSQSPDTSLTVTVTVTNTATGETAAVQSVQRRLNDKGNRGWEPRLPCCNPLGHPARSSILRKYFL